MCIDIMCICANPQSFRGKYLRKLKISSNIFWYYFTHRNCMKSVRIRSFFLVFIFSHSVPIGENKDQKIVRIWTLLTQCGLLLCPQAAFTCSSQWKKHQKNTLNVQSSGVFIVNIDLMHCSDIFKSPFEQVKVTLLLKVTLLHGCFSRF